MKRKMLNIPANVVLFSLSVLLLLPIIAMAEGDGGWTTTASPGCIFLIEEDLLNNQNYMAMTVLKPDLDGTEIYFGPASGSVGSTYLLEPLIADSDMIATWQFSSVTQATVTVDSCTTNCLWQSGQEVTLNKFFGDKEVVLSIGTGVPKTGQTTTYGTRDDGELEKGVMWPNPRFTDNGDGTVRDNLTGLIWTKNANCFGDRTRVTALSDCNSLVSGSSGLSDGSSQVTGGCRM